MNVQIEESWKAHLKPEFDKDYFRTLTDFVKSEYSQYQIFPPGKLIFNAFNLCPFDKVKVVIIGQDPYHGPGQAHGLCFSVNVGSVCGALLPFGSRFPQTCLRTVRTCSHVYGSPLITLIYLP